jgi:branched-chain amino acid transport system substrate-binding protein
MVSLTGESSLTGPPQKAALQLRLDQIGNQIAGRPIQLIVDDDASSPTTGVDMAKKQLLLDKVDAIIGPTFAAAAVAAGNFMKTASPAIPIIIATPKSGNLLQNATNNNIYLPMGTDASAGYYTGLYAYDKLKCKTATTLLEDMISGWDKVGSFTKAFEKEGGKSVQQQAIKSGTVDFSPYLASLQQADCVVFWFTPGLTARFLAQYFATGKTMQLVIPDANVCSSQTMSQIGDKTVGMISEINYSTLFDTPMNTAWVADYQKKAGNFPTIPAAAVDQALLIYLEAVKATNGDTSPAKINDALHKIKVDTLAGPVSFTPQGMGIGNLYMAQSIKSADRIDWKVLDQYSNIILDVPQGATPVK